MPYASSRKRGRPHLSYLRPVDSFAKSRVIRKPIYLANSDGEDRSSRSFSSDSDSKDMNRFPVMYTGIREPISKLFISVVPFRKQGPKPGQKRNKYRKRKKRRKLLETEDELEEIADWDSYLDNWMWMLPETKHETVQVKKSFVKLSTVSLGEVCKQQNCYINAALPLHHLALYQ